MIFLGNAETTRFIQFQEFYVLFPIHIHITYLLRLQKLENKSALIYLYPFTYRLDFEKAKIRISVIYL